MAEKGYLTKSAFKQLVNSYKKINSRDYAAALKIYLSLYEENISSSFAYTIAKCYLNLFDYSSAKKWIKRSIAQEPLDRYYLLLAEIYDFEYEYDKAIKIILAYLREHPYDEWALHKVISYYIEPGGEQYFPKGFVRECLIKLVNRNSDHNLPFYCLELAKIEFANGEYSIAEGLLNRALFSLEPISPILLNYIEELMEKVWKKK